MNLTHLDATMRLLDPQVRPNKIRFAASSYIPVLQWSRDVWHAARLSSYLQRL
jgi:hypothetical protein